jgi:hypothetical protein
LIGEINTRHHTAIKAIQLLKSQPNAHFYGWSLNCHKKPQVKEANLVKRFMKIRNYLLILHKNHERVFQFTLVSIHSKFLNHGVRFHPTSLSSVYESRRYIKREDALKMVLMIPRQLLKIDSGISRAEVRKARYQKEEVDDGSVNQRFSQVFV